MSTTSVRDGLAAAALATALAAAGLALVLLPQARAQRPAHHGVVTLQLDRQGGLRVWNQPLAPQQLPALLDRVQRRAGDRQRQVRLRLVPEPDVPWDTVRGLIARLEASGLPLELQLP